MASIVIVRVNLDSIRPSWGSINRYIMLNMLWFGTCCKKYCETGGITDCLTCCMSESIQIVMVFCWLIHCINRSWSDGVMITWPSEDKVETELVTCLLFFSSHSFLMGRHNGSSSHEALVPAVVDVVEDWVFLALQKVPNIKTTVQKIEKVNSQNDFN